MTRGRTSRKALGTSARQLDGWLVAVSAATGLSGYVFNAVVARSLGAVYLGHMMASFGVALVAATPAALLVLPLARWAAAAPAWRTAWLRWEVAALGAGVLMGGALFKLGFVLLIARIAPRGWWLPLGLYLAAQAPGAFHAAMLTGRRRYRSVSWVTLVGGIGKLGLLVLGLRLLPSATSASAVWAVALSAWIAVLVGWVALKRTPDGVQAVAPPVSLWPIGVGGAVVSAWLAWDVSLAGLVLPARELGEFAVAATIGKVPFHLSSLLVSRGVLESAWGSGSVRRLRRLITGLGLATAVGAATLGGAVLHAFGVPVAPPYLLGGYAASATLLALLSFELGRSGAVGRHVWPAAAASLVLWTVIVATLRPGVAELLALLLLALAVALGTVLAASRRRGRPRDLASTVTDSPVDKGRA